MSLTTTPTKSGNTPPTDTQRVAGIEDQPQGMAANNAQGQKTGAISKVKEVGLGAGETGATAMLSPEEKLAVQMERTMALMAENMAKMQYEFQEHMLRENAIWKKDMENLIKKVGQSANENKLTTELATAAATSTANAPVSTSAPVLQQESASMWDNTALPITTPAFNTTAPPRINPVTTQSLLMLTPPSRRPARRTVQMTQNNYARINPSERESSDEEFHTTRVLEPRRVIVRPPARTTNGHNVQLDRWGISFDGDDEKVPVEEFIFRVEHLQQLHDIPWSIIMGDFHKILKGKAQDWYWLHLRTIGSQPWHSFKAAMIKQFKTHRSDFDIMKQLVERKQRHNEEVEDFIHHMRKLHARLTAPMSERELIHIIKGNMNEEVARILYSMDIRSLPELCKEYHRAQRIFVRRRTYQPPANNFQRPNRPVVNEILADENDEVDEDEHFEAEVDELRRQPPKCWNCQEVGHTYMECSKARTIFCYKCGRPQTITPRCPKCNPGNANRGPTAASNSSSTDQQQQQ